MSAETALKALELIANSWPIAAAVIGVSAAIVVHRLIKRATDYGHQERMDRLRGNQAVVVRHSEEG